jgi:outer membrane lipoprotein-sorting protein
MKHHLNGSGKSKPMERNRLHRYLMVAALTIVIAGSVDAQTADQILARADAIFTLNRVWSRSVMTVTRNGRERTPQEMESYSLSTGGRSLSLTVLTAPRRLRGTAYLMADDELWVRFGSTGRVRKLSSSASSRAAADSDFSYNDMGDGSSSFTADYAATLDGTERISAVDCWRLVLTPLSGSEAEYERLVVFVSRNDYRYLRVEYFADGVNIKTMDLADFRPVGGVDYPFRITMTSHERDSATVIETLEMEYDSRRVREDMFTASYLESIE